MGVAQRMLDNLKSVPLAHDTHVTFQTKARGVLLAEAETHREVLVRHGLLESTLTELFLALAGVAEPEHISRTSIHAQAFSF
jgi:hypothetical protein